MKKIIKTTVVSLVILPSLLLADMDRCISCHGVDFEIKALGVSKVVKGMSEKEIKFALDGYKNGTYGGSMKELMIQEVNVGVDTDAMAADVYSESITKGFEEPSEDFIFQKRFSVKTLQKLKMNIKNIKSKKEMKKISAQIKSIAFSMYTYDSMLQEKISFNKFKPNPKLNKKYIFKTVSDIKRCVDHSFTEDEIVKCRVQFLNLAGSLVQNEAKMMKKKQSKLKAPIYIGEGAVDISKYLDKK
ncbi:MAG: hypothetical protein U9Q30_04720 [Campylobacterota bacterium]|nr:hypothetical protein [Campylobacterota bacterium]